MKGFKKNGKFRPTTTRSKTSSLMIFPEPQKPHLEKIKKRHAPNGIFKHKNPRTDKIETIKLNKIHAIHNDGKEKHALVGKGSDGRPVTKIVR